jgi:predicted O-methyltransferase YrrM
MERIKQLMKKREREWGKIRIPFCVVLKYIRLLSSAFWGKMLIRWLKTLLHPDEITQYVESLIPRRTSLLQQMEKYAEENHIPIMELIGIEVMLQILHFMKPSKILEIGTAIGYSAIRMAEALPDAQIVTIERDEHRFLEAKNNISLAGLEPRIDVKFGDALEIVEAIEAEAPFDCIFIDAAKGQYQRFFNIYSRFLHENGTVISDNILFKGLVARTDGINKSRTKSMVEKIKAYNVWLMNHPDFQTTIYPIGDGIAVSIKR